MCEEEKKKRNRLVTVRRVPANSNTGFWPDSPGTRVPGLSERIKRIL